MLIIALFQLLPLLAIHSRPVSGAPYNPWVEISGTEFDHFPVKRSDSPEYALHAARHALRFKQHEQQKRNYIRNLEDRDHVNEHAEVMRLARESSTDVIAPRENSSGRVGGLRARAPGDDHSQPMADWFSGGVDLMYTAPMYVGSNQQGMDIVPDTGSSDFWVPWSKSNMASNHASFDPNNSTTFTETEYKFEQTYGLGKAEGIIGLDTVQMGGFKVQNQIFGVATAVDEQFMRQNNDGIMGFASSKLSKYPATNFFENLIKSQVIAEPYFSVFLTRGRDSQPGKRGIVYGSELCLGCLATVPPELGSVTGDMLMVPLSVWGFWQVAMDGITLNGKTIAGTSGQVILDTGTTLNYLPQAIADAMLSPIGATRHSDGSYTAPVANIDATTRFGFTIGGQRFEMRAEDLVNAFTDETKTEYLLTVAASAITGTQGEPLGILGDSFLKNVISVYHYSYRGVPSVGIQQIALSSGSSSGSADPSAGLPTTTTAIPRPTGRFGETGAGAASATIAASGSVDAGTYAGGGSAVITAKAGAAGTGAAQSSAGVGGSGTGNNGSFKGAGWRRADMGRAMGVVVLIAALMGFLV